MTGFRDYVFFSSGESQRLSWLNDAGQFFDQYDAKAFETPGASSSFYPFKDRLFFAGWNQGNAAAGWELWATDLPWQNGTASQFANLNPESPGNAQNDSLPSHFTEMDGWLYFTARYNSDTPSLFRMSAEPDSTPERVPAQQGEPPQIPQDVQHLLVRPPVPNALVEPDKHVLYYFGRINSQPPVLFRCSNEALPVQVHPSFAAGSYYDYSVSDLQLCGDLVFFSVLLSNSPYSTVWRSDGTELGTRPLLPGVNATLLATVGDRIYFTRQDEELHLECMRTDGRERVLLLSQPHDPMIQNNPPLFTKLCVEGNTLYFSRKTSPSSQITTLWQTQGTPGTTQEIYHSSRKEDDSQFSTADTRVQVLQDKLYFTADDDLTGRELYALSLLGRLEITLVNGENTNQLTFQPSTNLGLQVVGQPLTCTLKLYNAGQRPIEDLKLTKFGNNSPNTHLQISPLGQDTLAPGETIEVNITLTADDATDFWPTLQVTGTTSGDSIFWTHTLLSTFLATDAAPAFWPTMDPVIAQIGQPITLSASIVTPQPVTDYAWHKNGVLVSNEEVFTVPASTTEDAGLYTLTVTSQAGKSTSPPVPVAILTPAPAIATFLPGQDVTLT
ncbi:MAG: immunoglobulin domain-containing protein, partial [Prosthecobacter sp.]|nr:immunoglobulin domain-containing protein [Prosthecobacter sp.]